MKARPVLESQKAEGIQRGYLIVNADDWGRDRNTTQRILECVKRGSVSSSSAMVFMEDSERAADIASQHGIEAGLHINLTTPFSLQGCHGRLAERQSDLARCLLRHRFSRVMYHPQLADYFDYVVKAQLEEFARLYGAEPTYIDGHHHIHLCTDVLLGKVLPRGVIVRRNFSFQTGEKGGVNRLYRRFADLMLGRRHPLTDFFYSLQPLHDSRRLQRIFNQARNFIVEIETHPANPDEYHFLTGGKLFSWTLDQPISCRRDIPQYKIRADLFLKNSVSGCSQ